MTIVEMAETVEREPGAPIAKDVIDPDLIKLSRGRLRVGLVTALGIVILCVYFVARLWPDRAFAGASTPQTVAAADIVAGKVDADALITVQVDPLMSQAIRATKAPGELGYRLTPTRGFADRLWIVFPGSAWEQSSPGAYTGRLRRLSDLPFADAARAYASAHPRPMFAPLVAVKAALTSNKVATVTGDTVELRDTDRVAYDTLDPATSILVVTFTPETKEHGPLTDATLWAAELLRLNIPAKPLASPVTTDKDGKPLGQSDALLGQARFEVAQSGAALTKQLEAARLWAARVEPVTKHTDTTWGALRTTALPDAQIDLVGLYVTRTIPSDAYVLITSERPADYWYVLPITVALIGIGLVFLWALVRAVKRDLLPARA